MTEMAMSKELAAMVQIENALEPLGEEERDRVLVWAASRFGVTISGPKRIMSKDSTIADQDDSVGETPPSSAEADSLAQFYDLASPSSDAERVLVVGYWFQFREGFQELEAQKMNTELKHLGHGIGNVTRALDWHKTQKPALMIQKRKEGTTKQARKKFILTNEGKKFVEKMLTRA